MFVVASMHGKTFYALLQFKKQYSQNGYGDTKKRNRHIDIYFFTTPNMAALVKQLLEADGFLHNVQTLPSFHRVQELQLHKLKDYMKKKTIDDQSFAESSNAVEKMKHFDQEQKQQLQQCIVDAYDRSLTTKRNKELQDYVNMPFMFPTNVWKEMYSHTTLEKRIFLTCTWLAQA